MNPYAGIIRTGSKGFYEIYRKSQPSSLSSPVYILHSYFTSKETKCQFNILFLKFQLNLI